MFKKTVDERLESRLALLSKHKEYQRMRLPFNNQWKNTMMKDAYQVKHAVGVWNNIFKQSKELILYRALRKAWHSGTDQL